MNGQHCIERVSHVIETAPHLCHLVAGFQLYALRKIAPCKARRRINQGPHTVDGGEIDTSKKPSSHQQQRNRNRCVQQHVALRLRDARADQLLRGRQQGLIELPVTEVHDRRGQSEVVSRSPAKALANNVHIDPG